MTSVPRRAHGLALAAVLFTVATGAPASAQDVQAPAQIPAEAREGPMPSFASLFTTLPMDLRPLPTVTNGLWLGGAGALALAVHPKDRTITQQASGALGLEEVLDSGEPLGDGLVQASGALGAYLVGRFANRADVAIVGADLVRAQIITAGITRGIKVAANRQRPDGSK
jgi:hypothetical protein